MALIYISSTYLDLIDQRKIAIDAVIRRGHHPIGMEYYTASEERPLDKCLVDVRRCDYYLGIYAFRYGYTPDGFDKSITHLEYEEAGKAGKHRFLFVIDDGASWPRNLIDKNSEKVDKFREIIKSNHTVSLIKDINRLYGEILAALPGNIIPKIPDFLPYLSDRSDQHDELNEIISKCKNCLHQKPLICIVHGDEFECHEMFIKKIRSESLPKLLGLPKEKDSIELLPVKWPAAHPSVETRFSRMKIELGIELVGNSIIEYSDIVQELNRRIDPLIIYFTIHSAIWYRNESDLIQSWIEYWDNLPDLAYGKKLIVILCIKYKNTNKLSFFEALKHRKLNERIRQYVKQLNFDEYHKINRLIFSELCSVKQDQLDDWIRLAAEYCHSEKLRKEIEEFYETRHLSGVCMAELAEKLAELCRKTQILGA